VVYWLGVEAAESGGVVGGVCVASGGGAVSGGGCERGEAAAVRGEGVWGVGIINGMKGRQVTLGDVVRTLSVRYYRVILHATDVV